MIMRKATATGCLVASAALAVSVALTLHPAARLPLSQSVVEDNSPTGSTEPRAAEVLLSRQLLRETGVSIGDTVMLAASPDGAHAAPFRVTGVYEPVPDPRRFSAERLEARLHLPDLNALAAEAGEEGADVVSA